MNRVYFISKMIFLVFYIASLVICLLITTGCSFILYETTNFHNKAMREVTTTIRVDEVTSAQIDPNGTLTIGFSGWDNCLKMNSESKEHFSIQVQTMSDLPFSSELRCLNINRTNIDRTIPDKENTRCLPVHVVSLEDIRPSWQTLARRVSSGVWLRKDRLQFLYVPKSELTGKISSLLVQSHAEMTRKDPQLVYYYPVVIPVLLTYDIVSLPFRTAIFTYRLFTEDMFW